jgi:hypothetical protein
MRETDLAETASTKTITTGTGLRQRRYTIET